MTDEQVAALIAALDRTVEVFGSMSRKVMVTNEVTWSNFRDVLTPEEQAMFLAFTAPSFLTPSSEKVSA